ncbi:imidazole glycerol phosphate synthase subunit HisH [Lactiplantibacillus plantarum]|nr:imidazole glycerol phosphate synthase subunit HisH [Lactiplantibacillus plantarum]
MFAIVDYDTGNTRNLKKAFDYLQVSTILTADPQQLAAADAVILPGVGAFAAAMAALKERQLVGVLQALARSGKPVLGICLGMQLLFESSSEYGEHAGLGLLSGRVSALPTDLNVKVPQMGWNQNELRRPDSPFASIDAAYTYFVHSYYAVCPATESCGDSSTRRPGSKYCSASKCDWDAVSPGEEWSSRITTTSSF